MSAGPIPGTPGPETISPKVNELLAIMDTNSTTPSVSEVKDIMGCGDRDRVRVSRGDSVFTVPKQHQ